MRNYYLLFILFVIKSFPVNGQATNINELISINKVTGKIEYKPYSNNGENNKINILPDFSYAGYKGGGVSLPNAEIMETISPINGDNTQHIQNAIDRVSKLPLDQNGLRGKVLLKAGEYAINGTLVIAQAGVILAGEGTDNKSGTLLRATKKQKQNIIRIGNNSSSIKKIDNTIQNITDITVPVGSTKISIKNASAYNIGDTVLISIQRNDEWIKKIGMKQYGWTAKGYTNDHERIIIKKEGNILTLNIPMVESIDKRYGNARIFKLNVNRIVNNSGVENLRLISNYTSDTDENHGWEAVKISSSENCWVKNIVVENFGQSAVTILNNSIFNTIEDCAMISPKSKVAGGRRYAFNIVNGSFNLVQRCYSDKGRHDFVTGKLVKGPNVFLDCISENATADSGPHQRWATGILYDNVSTQAFNVINAKKRGTGHGWVGAQVLIWNSKTPEGKMIVQSPPGARNWVIQTTDKASTNNSNNVKSIVLSLIKMLDNQMNNYPRSLYLKQLEDRLGKEAVNNITTDPQRRGLFKSNRPY